MQQYNIPVLMLVLMHSVRCLMFTDDGVEQKGIPDFWLKILKNMDIVDPMIRVWPLSLYSAYLCEDIQHCNKSTFYTLYSLSTFTVFSTCM